ncbi:uncharacterized protein J3D65DRAFT_600757 [Phyllosticta citribraziliensis]|uniref:rRNA-processing protein n=1 Tax=Phyllosticta citribraziliensis TaxID=989973 RepID=A0ABR1LZL3_9PEZI
MSASEPEPATANPAPVQGMRKNGKQWHQPKKPFRPTAGLTSYAKRTEERKALAAVKAKEKELKDDKEAARQAHVQNIKERREKKAERERYAQLAAKMHAKKVERLKRKEKRNKLLKS